MMRLRDLPIRAIDAALRSYKRWISPWLPRTCRYSPTCSEYARLAVNRHGAVSGSARAIWRILRCQPFAAGGIDLP